MRIVAISDTHTQHSRLQILECDVLVHCGDFTYQGKHQEVSDFYHWLINQPARHYIVVAGNHEITFDSGMTNEYAPLIKNIIAKSSREDVHYLENESLVIDGIKFWGTPWTPRFYDWAFNGVEGDDAIFIDYRDDRERFRPLDETFAQIHDDTNVIICHGPPNGMVDRNSDDGRCGSVAMTHRVQELASLRLFLCGHIHEARGQEVAMGNTHFCNVSSLGRDYETLQKPVIIDLDEKGFVQSVEGYE